MVSPRHQAPELASGQAIPETTANEAGRFWEQMGNFAIVVSQLSTPPGSPAEAQAHIVGPAPTGAWSSFTEGRIAFYLSGAWKQIPVYEGTFAYNQATNTLYRHNGGAGVAAWQAFSASAAEVWAMTSEERPLTPKSLADASAPVALTSSASITPNGNNGFNFSVTLAHSGQLENPTNFKVGQSGVIVITQDGTGNRTWTYGTNWKFPGGAPVLSTAAGAIDALTYYVSASGVILCNLTKAYSS